MNELDYIPPELTPDAKKSIQDYITQSQQRTPSEYERQDQEMMSPAKGLLNDSNDLNDGRSSALSSAIKQKYRKGFAQNQRSENFQSKVDAHNRYFNRLQNAALLSNEEHKLNEQRRLAIYKAKMNKKAARGQIIGNLLGIAGAIVGGYASGGNPAGIAAGYSIGQGAGQMVAK